MSFSYAGSRTNGAPVTRKMQVGETCYTGQLVMHSHAASDCKGHTWLLDPAAQDCEDDWGVLGIVSGVYTINDAGWNSTYHGDTATCDTTKAAMVANDPVGATEIEMTVIVAEDTLIKGPLYNADYGTAITELVSAADSAATTVTHASQTGINYADDYATCYCRSGPNRGHYRTAAESNTGTQLLQIPFPYSITAGDIFVTGPGVPGITALQVDAHANFVDASDTLSIFFAVWLHTQNLEKSGEEHYVFAFTASACGFKGFQGL